MMLAKLGSNYQTFHNFRKTVHLISFSTVSISIWLNLAASAQAYDVTKLTLTPNPGNDPPAQKIVQVPKSDNPEDESKELIDKVFLPRNDKLQRFDFEAEGKFTGRDIERRNPEATGMAINANFVDIQTDRAGIALAILFGGGGRTQKAITMSTFKGEVPFTTNTIEGDTWKLTGSFQVGCSADGKVFGTTNSKVERLSPAVEFPGDNNRTFRTPRIECEPLPKPASGS